MRAGRDGGGGWHTAPRAQVTTYPINGDVEEIERTDGRTEVLVDEGLTKVAYELDDSLIAFGAAIEDGDLERAVVILEPQPMKAETEAMWAQLRDLALKARKLHIARRCAAALGDVSCARFVHKAAKIAAAAEARMGGDGRDFWMVRARLAQLQRDFTAAEHILLDQGKVCVCVCVCTRACVCTCACGARWSPTRTRTPLPLVAWHAVVVCSL